MNSSRKLRAVEPVIKIKLNKNLNLPKIKQQETQFESFLKVCDSEANLRSTSNLSRTLRSWSKQSHHSSKEKEKMPTEYTLYGFNRINTTRNLQILQDPLPVNQLSARGITIPDLDVFLKYQFAPPPHGQIRVLNEATGFFEWQDIKLLEYYAEKQVFIVQHHPFGPIKRVKRMNITFADQFEPASVQRRINQSRSKDLLDKSSENLQTLPPLTRTKLKKLFWANPRQRAQVTSLLDQVTLFYEESSKRCQQGQYLIFRPRDVETKFPQFTKVHTFLEDNLLTIQKEFQACKLIMHELFQNSCLQQLSSVMKQLLPFSRLQESLNAHCSSLRADLKKLRLSLISEMQQTLHPQFNCFQLDAKAYEKSRLKSIVKLLDLLYKQYFKSVLLQVVDQNRTYFSSYSFTIARNFLRIQPRGLVELNCEVQLNRSENQAHIVLCPPKAQIVSTLLMDAYTLLEIASTEMKMEFQIMKLLELVQVPLLTEDEQSRLQEEVSGLQIMIENEFCKCEEWSTLLEPYSFLGVPLTQVAVPKLLGVDQKELKSISQLKLKHIKRFFTSTRESIAGLERMAPNLINLGLFTINNVAFKQRMRQQVDQNVALVSKYIGQAIQQTASSVNDHYSKILIRCQQVPQNQQEFVEVKLFLDQLMMQLSSQRLQTLRIKELIEELDSNFIETDSEIIQQYFHLLKWPQEILEKVNSNKFNLKQQEKYFLRQLHDLKAEFVDFQLEVQQLALEIKSIKSYHSIQTSISKVGRLEEYIELTNQRIGQFNQSEMIFGLPKTSSNEIRLLTQEMAPFKSLWSIISNFELQKEQWLNTALQNLDSNSMEEQLQESIKQTIHLQGQFQQLYEENALMLIREFRQQIDYMRENLWIPEYLAIEAFIQKPNLWKELLKELQFSFYESFEDCTMQLLINKGVLQKKQTVQEFSVKAEKIWGLEKRLNDISVRASGIKLELVPYQDTFLFKNTDEALSTLDELQQVIDMVKLSPVIKSVQNRVLYLEQKIQVITDTLELGMASQKSWVYLEPIFNGSDIRNKLPQESESFYLVDQTYRNMMKAFAENQFLWEAIETDKQKHMFQLNVHTLDIIQKSLKTYLEAKRKHFPRFYFLSDEELVHILALSKNPRDMSNYVSQCFEGVQSLTLDSWPRITGMVSYTGEQLKLLNQISLKIDSKKPPHIELWFEQLELQMRNSLRHHVRETARNIYVSPMYDLIQKHQTQCCQVAYQLKCTKNAESYIICNNLNELQVETEQELKDIIQLIKSEQSLSRRLSLEGLAILSVNFKDMVQQLMNLRVESLRDFGWLQQFRYYLREQDLLQLELVSCRIDYGFEYFGQLKRLVITPLTIRCQMNIVNALRMSYGGSVEGPAGTGKSETIKDLSKNLGMPCHIFNCSEGFTVFTINNFLKGLIQSGSWSCFDEFNRIDSEVLSVVAMNLQLIQQVRKQQLRKICFEEEELTFNPTCAINITMNQGYTGRSELPDNIKLLFRPFQMVAPNYEMIAEMFLYSLGFDAAQRLSKKIVTCLKLLSEQLSKNDHYDFGMRNLKSVIEATKHIKCQSEDETIYRALKFVNEPCLVGYDLGLLHQVLSDLFPEIRERIPHTESPMQNALLPKGYTLLPAQLKQCQRLIDLIKVRNGVICLGQVQTGKSTVISSAAAILDATQISLNPKAVTVEQLYGSIDMDMKQWQEGVLTQIIRENLKSKLNIFVVFDGPIDSKWIENLNTALDDNQKLCLTSGEVLRTQETMKILFETDHVKAVSPATISRCGIIYFEQLDWVAFLKNISQSIQLSETLLEKIIWYDISQPSLLEKCIEWYLRDGCKAVNLPQNLLITSFVRLLSKLLQDLTQEVVLAQIDGIILFCLIWSFGGTLQIEGRSRFKSFLQSIQEELQGGIYCKAMGSQIQSDMPAVETYFDSYFENGQWMQWGSTERMASLSLKTPRSSCKSLLIVPTAESDQYSYFCQLGVSVVICGPSGIGKTLFMMPSSQYTIPLTIDSDCNTMQKLVETKVNKKIKIGVYGPEKGQIKIFLDDLNMAQADPNGAHSAIEVLRQLLVQGGWYDLESKKFKTLTGVEFIAAMQLSRGEKIKITERFIKFFNLLVFSDISPRSVHQIVETNLLPLMEKISASSEFSSFLDKLISQIIFIHNSVQKQLRPVPSRGHYTCNFRQYLAVVSGVLRLQSIASQIQVAKLWIHESMRVYGDKLVGQHDQQLLIDILKQSWNEVGYSSIDPKALYWFASQSSKSAYEQHEDLNQLKLQLTEFLHERFKGRYDNIILFNYAISHILRLTRCLTQPSGHVLVIGMGGLGRQSVSRLSNLVAFGRLPQSIDPSQWDEQVQDILLSVGLELKPTTLLLTDSQLKHDSQYQDLSSIMNSGVAPRLFPPDIQNKVSEDMRYDEFTENNKANIHIILCIQPLGDCYKRQLRTFPNLVNCSTTDWFSKWPEDALMSTASKYLHQSLATLAVGIYQSVEEINLQFMKEQARFYYITPLLYLNKLQIYQELFQEKREFQRKQIDKYETGVVKLFETEKNVDKIREQLFSLQPKLEKSNIESIQILNSIKKQQFEADSKRVYCEEEERNCSIKKQQANNLKDYCKTQLESVLPLLKKATEALDSISKDDMSLLKSFTNPPPSVVVVMQGLLYCFDEYELVKSKNQKEPQNLQDFWDYSKKHLLNDKLIKRIKKMKLEQIKSINPHNIARLRIFVLNPLFDKEKVFNSSSAAGNLSEWIRAVLDTYLAVQIIEPKKNELKDAEIKLKIAEEEVQIKRLALRDIQCIIEDLSEQYQVAKEKKDRIQSEVDKIQAQLDRAQKLIYGLGEEKVRWSKQIRDLKKQQLSIEGDCIITSSIISYHGVYPTLYRQRLLDGWKFQAQQHKISISDDHSLQKHICNPAIIHEWIQQQLPNDQVAIDNAIIMHHTNRWPLMIDPQVQANAWIKNLESGSNLVVVDSSNSLHQHQTQLENALQLGYPCLVENLNESIDPIIYKLLEQKVTRTGSQNHIKLGDRVIEVNHDFRLYLTTKLSNPHYSPEVCLIVNMLNFSVTLEGLTEQLMNIIVKIDEPVKEEQRIRNIQEIFLNKIRISETSDIILELLSTAVGELLEDEKLVLSLENSKSTALEIDGRIKRLQIDAEIFNRTREFYRGAAAQISGLYFVVFDLQKLQPVYVWSLDSYLKLYQKAVVQAGKNKSQRLQNVIKLFTELLSVQVDRSLLERDKAIFKFLVSANLKGFDMSLLKELISIGKIYDNLSLAGAESGTLLQGIKPQLSAQLSYLEVKYPTQFGGILKQVTSDPVVLAGLQAGQLRQDGFFKQYSQIQWLVLLKIFNQNEFAIAFRKYIDSQLQDAVPTTNVITMETYFQESSPQTPILFLVGVGADPRQEILDFAHKQNMGGKFKSYSLGSRSNNQALLSRVRDAIAEGQWVLLQNCHLATQFMVSLDEICQEYLRTSANKDFRLWISTQPTSQLPINILLRCKLLLYEAIKISYEQPQNLKKIIMRSFYQLSKDFLASCENREYFQKMIIQLIFFHGCVIEKKKYGHQGWKLPYDFSQNDLFIGLEQLRDLLNERYPTTQILDTMLFFIAELNYGGRITNNLDKEIFNTLLRSYLNFEQPSKQIQTSLLTIMDQESLWSQDISVGIGEISKSPLHNNLQFYGLHPSSEVVASRIETNRFLSTVDLLFSSAQKEIDFAANNELLQTCSQLLSQLDSSFALIDVTQISADFLVPQVLRYQSLINFVSQVLNKCISIITGESQISTDFEEILLRLQLRQLPQAWIKLSYPTRNHLGEWWSDLNQRLQYIKGLVTVKPKSFWIGGFYSPKAFIFSQIQTTARQYEIPIEQIQFQFKFYKSLEDSTEYEGFIISGLKMIGARFDYSTQGLEEIECNQIIDDFPSVQFIPTTESNVEGKYECPIYQSIQINDENAGGQTCTEPLLFIYVPCLGKEKFKKFGVSLSVQILESG